MQLETVQNRDLSLSYLAALFASLCSGFVVCLSSSWACFKVFLPQILSIKCCSNWHDRILQILARDILLSRFKQAIYYSFALLYFVFIFFKRGLLILNNPKNHINSHVFFNPPGRPIYFCLLLSLKAHLFNIGHLIGF